ncbi:MAG: hypothetical protein KDD62_06060, partial [Bdellovibrionales bacterium]|nr:hypothetical protein [Bdellovibrionales bacterium]
MTSPLHHSDNNNSGPVPLDRPLVSDAFDRAMGDLLIKAYQESRGLNLSDEQQARIAEISFRNLGPLLIAQTIRALPNDHEVPLEIENKAELVQYLEEAYQRLGGRTLKDLSIEQRLQIAEISFETIALPLINDTREKALDHLRPRKVTTRFTTGERIENDFGIALIVTSIDEAHNSVTLTVTSSGSYGGLLAPGEEIVF